MSREPSLHTFLLTIRLGNDGMRTPEDVADQLDALAEHLRTNPSSIGTMRDINGNTVGSYAAKWPKE